MRNKALVAAVGMTAALALVAAACGSDSDSGSSATTAAGAATTAAGGKVDGKIGVILPDTKSSARWEANDRPLLEAAFQAAGVEYDIQNAEGDKTKMATIADQMVTNGAKVLMIVNLDSGSGAAIQKKAADAGVKNIDYDRLTLGGNADVYVSFDNVKVGEEQGKGLVKCLTEGGTKEAQVIRLNGSPTDNNATLFAQGYNSILEPLFKSGELKAVGDQSVPDWDNQKGGQIFEQLLTANSGKVDGVLAANDGLGGAAIAVLKKNNLQVPVTGQDATVQGLQNILSGDQCMTVYKAIKKEADAASAAAIALLKGEKPATTGTVIDTETKREVPSVLAVPQAIFLDSVKDVVADGFVTAAEICKGFEDQCTKAGVK